MWRGVEGKGDCWPFALTLPPSRRSQWHAGPPSRPSQWHASRYATVECSTSVGLLDSHASHQLVDLGEVEASRVPVAEPYEAFAVVVILFGGRMRRVGFEFEDVLEAAEAAAVFGRAVAFAGDADRRAGFGGKETRALDHE